MIVGIDEYRKVLREHRDADSLMDLYIAGCVLCDELEALITENKALFVDQYEYEKEAGAFRAKLKAAEDKPFEAIGWAYADCCATLNEGGDPRQTKMSDVLERATKDLSLGVTEEKKGEI